MLKKLPKAFLSHWSSRASTMHSKIVIRSYHMSMTVGSKKVNESSTSPTTDSKNTPSTSSEVGPRDYQDKMVDIQGRELQPREDIMEKIHEHNPLTVKEGDLPANMKRRKNILAASFDKIQEEFVEDRDIILPHERGSKKEKAVKHKKVVVPNFTYQLVIWVSFFLVSMMYLTEKLDNRRINREIDEAEEELELLKDEGVHNLKIFKEKARQVIASNKNTADKLEEFDKYWELIQNEPNLEQLNLPFVAKKYTFGNMVDRDEAAKDVNFS